MPIRCLIVDDEPLAIELMENYIAKTDRVELVKSFRNPLKAFDYLQENSVDLVFLDIQMPDLTGIELVKTLMDHTARWVFTTAYREHAVESYELKASDYLVKPFSFQRFLQAVDKVSEQIQHHQTARDYIHVKSEGKTFRISLADIVYVESCKDYIKINTMDGRSLVSYQHISHFEKDLPPSVFMRIHRAFIINIRQIVAFGSTSVHIGKEDLPIGRSYKEKVLAQLQR